ncbi:MULTISPECIES: branched-chain amino acid ABC transporter permease [Archaeoglobus]|jgi:branched-chain amino acid transport system permease protein|uniref:Branched-chain amino acid ABC-type transport system, permease component n=2 Tax=Archaeoglobus fulgidus TaxID=2234 RepID=A0A075WCY5_ARCFL|nr:MULTISPECIES: branched-chain amino acid ABC transporter permease [Archaeoglobus]AIG98270.1 Branched-chain amino acid ABC-type transport system, permease component [Archaeoglobus fulgidus DSM 8774]KUJ92861.1 MAG: Branched-chain amino acid ABC transporter, permease protein (BraD-4) [Archaeoglobus fulgidus]KUK06264.1 MAG: Branched-chain amino acid ABC transporter, permease protein (BraD-4) [Archaeoglobus fulgidus]MDI3497363.1 branched-chain amino acid transport system permease protein [Archaeog
MDITPTLEIAKNIIEGSLIYSNLLVLLSIGLTITYITTAVPNFAQGSFAVFGAYIALTMLRLFGIHPYASLPVTFILGGLLGIAAYILVLRPLIQRGATVVIMMIATLAFDLILLGIIGSYSDTLASITRKSTSKYTFIPTDFTIFSFSASLFVSSLVIILVLASLAVLLYKTKFGIALRASMENPALAEVMGVNVEYTRIFSWFLSGALAAMAGCLLPFKYEIVPSTGAIIIVSIFASSIVGGLSSIYGALIGGYIIGFSETSVTYGLSTFFGAGLLLYGRVVSLIVLVITLVLAPRGITGVNWRRVSWRK